MNYRYITIVLAVLTAAFQGFGSGRLQAELPLPSVPATLTKPQQRADYVMAHFWDGMDFSDTLRSRNREFMELNMVNFMSLFPHGSAKGISESVGSLLQRVVADSASLHLVTGIFRQYLDEPDSPMRSEEHYIIYLEELLKQPELTEADRIRPSYDLAMAKLNRPGAVATDFAYIDRDGRRQTLHTTATGKRILLLFYDPECSHCEDVIKEVAGSATIRDCIERGELAVLAVYTEGKRRVWDETKGSMPQGWLVGFDDSEIVERELYHISAMPAIYLLDSSHRVLFKNASLPELEAALKSSMARLVFAKRDCEHKPTFGTVFCGNSAVVK